MKARTILLLTALLGPVTAPQPLPAAETISDQEIRDRQEALTRLYDAGRRAFHKGDLAAAKAAFSTVLRASPDFDPAKMYMARIRHAEAQWEARPRSQKIAETARIESLSLRKVPLADALEVLRRELERQGQGSEAGAVQLLTDLPAGALEREVDLTVRDLPMSGFIGAVAFAGNVRITFHPKGLAVTGAQPATPAPAPAAAGTSGLPSATAARSMQRAAQTHILPRVKFDNTPVREALAWLRQQAEMIPPPEAESGPRLLRAPVPLVVTREPVPGTPVTLDLRHVPYAEALNYVALVADMEVTWHPWGAGLAMKRDLAVNEPAKVP